MEGNQGEGRAYVTYKTDKGADQSRSRLPLLMGAATSSTSPSCPGFFAFMSLITRGRQRGREGVSFSAVPAEVVPTIAQCLTSYDDLCAFRRIDKTRHGALTPAALLPILTQLLPVVVASLGLGGLLVCIIPQLPLREALSHGCCTAYLIEQLSRRLFILERGGDWARWRPHLEMLYLLRGKRPLVLSDDNFGVFGSRAAFMSEREAVRQWKILSRWITFADGEQQRQLMDGNAILRPHNCRFTPTLLNSPSPLFPHVAFDPADPPTEMDGWTSPSCTQTVAFELFNWLVRSGHIRRIKSWLSWRPASAAFRGVSELLAASPGDAAQWGAGATVFDVKRPDGKGHDRLVVLGSEAMGEGHMAVIWLIDWGDCCRSVYILTTESAPHDKTRTVVMRALGDQLGGKVWREERDGQ
ncbi:unnamed protein product [Vitrella brassicaformis CCMP3155]|uniref:Uncharacterized protein n=1 Tax=Vitrella brassicaformis (strain CCMP3155) TaxID=1169540 RepID=A0A0G4EIL4_VITBC|nr:unnamed protein product [Vitrella brassicaformis CCMP3155]|eukprot:CEL95845.1 unnamed protein product [Vitrella brassicaformis CCMP3155]